MNTCVRNSFRLFMKKIWLEPFLTIFSTFLATLIWFDPTQEHFAGRRMSTLPLYQWLISNTVNVTGLGLTGSTQWSDSVTHLFLFRFVHKKMDVHHIKRKKRSDVSPDERLTSGVRRQLHPTWRPDVRHDNLDHHDNQINILKKTEQKTLWPLHSVFHPTVSFPSFSPSLNPSRPFPHTFSSTLCPSKLCMLWVLSVSYNWQSEDYVGSKVEGVGVLTWQSWGSSGCPLSKDLLDTSLVLNVIWRWFELLPVSNCQE